MNRFDAAGLEGCFFLETDSFQADVSCVRHPEAGHLQRMYVFLFPTGKDFICILETWLAGGENSTAAGFLDQFHDQSHNHSARYRCKRNLMYLQDYVR